MKREDVCVKIPALLHLTRLGYGYLPGKEARRDRETNILTDRLREAAERMNGITLAEDRFRRMLEDLKALLREPDLGRGFYRALRTGWNGLMLLDFDHPEKNEFLAGTEMACGTGNRRFRPDVTLFVNGLPLGIMEVKAPDQRGGLKSEYERMCRRFHQESFRPSLQAAQIWLFSNDRECGGLALLPRDGAYFTAGAPADFPVYPGPEKMPKRPREIGRPDRETERTILTDNGITDLPEVNEILRRKDPGTPTHRMLTGLMAPERFLFLLRYGIRYESLRDEDGRERIRKRMLNWDQMEALRTAQRKIGRGFRNWRIPCPGPGGRTLQGAALIGLLRDRIPECEISWVTGDETGMNRARADFRRLGLAEEALCLTEKEAAERGRSDAGQRIFIFPARHLDYRTERSAAAKLRAEDREAILITMGEEVSHEGECYTYLLECADGSLYCGWTNRLEERIRRHNEGKGAKYTRSRLPVKLVYWECFGTKQEAMSREWRLKQMTRAEKLALIRKKEADAEGREEADG